MGIRFDRESRRPTNGPIIFFSDPSSENSFSEEIRGAINSGLSFYAYRHPGDIMISFGSSEGYCEGLGIPGFVIGQFDPTQHFITIPYKGTGSRTYSGETYSFPHNSTSFQEYQREIENIISELSAYKESKTVAARVFIEKERIDPGATFFELHNRYPEAYIFCFSTPATGCWIGASPELLLKAKGDSLRTMALAGTRIINSNSVWDDKNIEEQRLVRQYISDIFDAHSLNPRQLESFTKKAGNIEHICTPFESDLCNDANELESLLHDLSPTPALCGSPRELSLKLISENESFQRGCYGGFCGPFHNPGDFTFNVVIRCASFTENEYCIYAGGGITVLSDLLQEWEETEMKSRIFRDCVIFK